MSFIGLSTDTVTSYLRRFCQLVIEAIYPNCTIIGGPGIEVQINESKFAERTYNCGNHVGGSSWIFKDIDQEKNWFAVVV